jgi:pimeloyl-ACP methyl ester carboxylesterase
MVVASRGIRRLLVLSLTSAAALLGGVPAAQAGDRDDGKRLAWEACGEEGFECATARLPRDYDHPGGRKLEIAVTRLRATDPERRIGSLFVNFGGPGGTTNDILRAIGKDLFGALTDRFDLVGFDPRGVGESSPSIDCKVNQETEGLYGQPFTTPENLDVGAWVERARRYADRCRELNADILPYVSTANVARDMDRLREAVGDKKLNYLGFSYGTFLGATYESLFPKRYRALVLDGALDADQYINRPTEGLFEQTQGFERTLGRFFQACAAHKDVCPFGGDDPWMAYDELLEQMYAQPLPASGDHPEPVDGDDLIEASFALLYAKQAWPDFAAMLAQAAAGDGTLVRIVVDGTYGWLPDGSYDPALDRYFTIGAIEQRYPHDLGFFLEAGRRSSGLFDHFWSNAGYVELPYALLGVRGRDVFRGPFRANPDATPTLVIGTTYDPATPYKGAKRLVADLGNARLLTMRGDGHTAFGGNSACIDAAVEMYLEDLVVPPAGTVCRQEVPFAAPEPVAAGQGAARRLRKILRALQPKAAPSGVVAAG